MIAGGGRSEGVRLACLVFERGQRPGIGRIEALARESRDYSVTHGADAPSGWVELLRDGLTFDLSGLVPAPAIPLPSMPRRYGLAEPLGDPPEEALVLAPGPHLSGAERLLPVVRTAAGLLAALARLPGVKAVGWLPSKSLCNPEWFASAVSAWLAGGPFPSLALAAFDRDREGSLRSHGLAFFTGQDFVLSAGGDARPEDDGRLAMRLADWLVAHGKLETGQDVVLSGAGRVRLEPGGDGLVRVSRT